jgi:hypothetical protein
MVAERSDVAAATGSADPACLLIKQIRYSTKREVHCKSSRMTISQCVAEQQEEETLTGNNVEWKKTPTRTKHRIGKNADRK